MTEATGIGESSALQDFEADLSGELAAAIQALDVRLSASFEAAEDKLLRMSELATTIVDTIVRHADSARQTLDSAQAATEQVIGRVGEGRSKTDEAIVEADSRREQALSVATVSATASEQAGDDLQKTTQESLTAMVDGVSDAIESLKTGLAGGTERLEEFSSALKSFGDDGETRLKDLCDELLQLAETADTQLEQGKQLLEQNSVGAVDGLTAEVEAALGVLRSAASDTSDAASTLGGFAKDFAGAYGDEIEDVVSFINQVLDLIDQIRPVLELADQLS
eukprot:gene32389-41962_t